MSAVHARLQRARAVAALRNTALRRGLRFKLSRRPWPEPASAQLFNGALLGVFVDVRLSERRQAAALTSLLRCLECVGPAMLFTRADGSVWSSDGHTAVQLAGGAQ